MVNSIYEYYKNFVTYQSNTCSFSLSHMDGSCAIQNEIKVNTKATEKEAMSHIDVCKLRVRDQIWSEHGRRTHVRINEKINPFTLRHPKPSSDDDNNNNNNNNFLYFLDDKDLSLAA